MLFMEAERNGIKEAINQWKEAGDFHPVQRVEE